MIAHLQRMPLFLLMVGVSGLAMYVPATHALILQNHHEARAFFYTGTLVLIVVILIMMALGTRQRQTDPILHLRALFLACTVLPAILAVPFFEAARTTTFVNAYFEMVSSLTTTGATLYDAPRLSSSLHLWRGQVAWMGGLMMWVAAAAVFAPLSLGGFEVTARGEAGQSTTHGGQMEVADMMKRWQRSAAVLAPIYSGLTLALWVMLLILGDNPTSALIHAMSVMSTSGISSAGAFHYANLPITAEVVIFLFLLFALSRLTFSNEAGLLGRKDLLTDPEFKLGLTIVAVVPAALFLRHWAGAFEEDDLQNLWAAGRAAWGAVFTVLSFLTTTGFQSNEWDTAQYWSGLETPGMILMGLALIGGGVATTAGGVKLLRVYVLYLQGLGEMEKLVHPSVVIGSRKENRRIRRKGAVIAWVYFMLVAFSIAAVAAALAAMGVGFEPAIALSVATLSTTGPLTQVAGVSSIDILSLGTGIKMILCGAMVLGRLETLAIIALLNPEIWTRE